jgi:hypothetical protein
MLMVVTTSVSKGHTMNHPLPEPTEPTSKPEPIGSRGGRNRVTLGVAAGVLAGGAIGLVATTPAWTSAATDSSGAEVVALQDDTTPDDADDTAAPDERPEPGERLRETLQPLVDDGTIDAAQADAVTEHLVENRPERNGRRGRRGLDGHGRNNTVVADLLGIDRETLRSELEAGNSIADIAEANGIEVQSVVDALIADAESHIDLAIAHGLDEERAAERLERITERIEEGVNRTRDTDG